MGLEGNITEALGTNLGSDALIHGHVCRSTS